MYCINKKYIDCRSFVNPNRIHECYVYVNKSCVNNSNIFTVRNSKLTLYIRRMYGGSINVTYRIKTVIGTGCNVCRAYLSRLNIGLAKMFMSFSEYVLELAL